MIFTFKPLLKQTIWGGDRIIPFKHLTENLPGVGESWEISGVPSDESVVAEGPYEGLTLNQLVEKLQAKLVGEDNYERFGNEFPLLIKFIDARQDLSIQVHPTDEIAQKRGKERGKTEMWYLMPSQPGAKLLSGLKLKITPEEYKQRVENHTIVDALAQYEVHEGDCFFLPAGRIHAIGAGCFLAEIQQTSDITYRIYDYNRRDKNGNLRQLHTEEAVECINYQVEDDYQTHYNAVQNEPVELVRCPYFTTTVYDLTEPMTLDYSELDSFVVLIAVGGAGQLQADSGPAIPFQAGDTLLLPATTKQVKVEGTVKFLETYV